MSHRRQPSEGLNVGEGFPTSYSSFAVSGSQDAGSASSSFASSKQATGGSKLKQRQSPPVTPSAKQKSYSPTVSSPLAGAPKVTFLDGTSASTSHSWQAAVAGLRRNWKFVAFFVAISTLLICGILLPLGPAQKPANRNVLNRPVRSLRQAIPTPPTEAASNRLSRWAQTVMGNDEEDRQPSMFEASETQEEIAMAADPDPEIVLMAQKAIAERRAARWAARWAKNKKRRTDDSEDDEEGDSTVREHPSRVARRQKLAATKTAEKTGSGVFQRFAKAFKAMASPLPASDDRKAWGSKEGGHILGTWGASHPELLDVDGGYAGI